MTLGDRMKRYEHAYRRTLPRRTYTLIRVDGRAFSRFTRSLPSRPFNPDFIFEMDLVARALCETIAGAQFAYVQSDEVSVLLTDFENHDTEPWMGGVEAKMLSLSAATATQTWCGSSTMPSGQFDSRLWTMSDPAEVVNYFIWRQRDAVKNSISQLAGHHFAHGELEGKNSKERMDMLTAKGVSWEELDTGVQRGRIVERRIGGWRVNPAPTFAHEWMMGMYVPIIGAENF